MPKPKTTKETVLEVLDAGMTRKEAGEAAGVTPARVGQIIASLPERERSKYARRTGEAADVRPVRFSRELQTLAETAARRANMTFSDVVRRGTESEARRILSGKP